MVKIRFWLGKNLLILSMRMMPYSSFRAYWVQHWNNMPSDIQGSMGNNGSVYQKEAQGAL